MNTSATIAETQVTYFEAGKPVVITVKHGNKGAKQ